MCITFPLLLTSELNLFPCQDVTPLSYALLDTFKGISIDGAQPGYVSGHSSIRGTAGDTGLIAQGKDAIILKCCRAALRSAYPEFIQG